MATRRKQDFDSSARERTGALGEFKRDDVIDIQQARMLHAMAELVAERGVANVSVAHVVERAGISRRTFYEIFSDREDCFLAAFDDAVERIALRVVHTYEQPGKWRERVGASLVELLSCLDNDLVSGRLAIVESLAAGPRALERRGNVLAQVIAAIDEGRTEAKVGAEIPPLAAEGAVGAVLAVIHGRMLEGAHTPLVELANPLMSMIVLPYLGPSAARRELERPVPEMVQRPARVAGDPLRDVEMRLTYRTVRVLMAVAANPAASNRVVGESAGIGDQGQISKLLSRLSKLGLVTNSGLGPGRGAPNAWMLTDKGAQVHQVLAGRLNGASA